MRPNIELLRFRFALSILKLRFLRRICGARAIERLMLLLQTDPKHFVPLVFMQLGGTRDPVFAWHMLNLLGGLPDLMIEAGVDSMSVVPLFFIGDLKDMPLNDQIICCKQMIDRIFNVSETAFTMSKVRNSKITLGIQRAKTKTINTYEFTGSEIVPFIDLAFHAWLTSHKAESTFTANDKTLFATLVLRCAGENDPDAQFIASLLFGQAHGVDRNIDLSREWLHKAANNGSAIAQCTLGNMHFFGHGVQKDLQVAKKWFSLSASQGFEPAKKAMLHITA
jgi:hypothetical protein